MIFDLEIYIGFGAILMPDFGRIRNDSLYVIFKTYSKFVMKTRERRHLFIPPETIRKPNAFLKVKSKLQNLKPTNRKLQTLIKHKKIRFGGACNLGR